MCKKVWTQTGTGERPPEGKAQRWINLHAQHSGSETLKTQSSPTGTTGRQTKWWKMKGSAKIRPNINLTKINSAWLLWLIQKKVFSESSFCKNSVHWRRKREYTFLNCVLLGVIGKSDWQYEEVFKGKYWRLQCYLPDCIIGNVTSPARKCQCS